MMRSFIHSVKPVIVEKQRLLTVVRKYVFLLVALLAVHGFAQSPKNAASLTPIPIDSGAIEALYGPNQDDTAGALDKSGCYVRGAQCVREGFVLVETAEAGAFGEVVTFPKDYRYATHDLFGSLLRTAAYDAKTSRHSNFSAAVQKVHCMDWELLDGTKNGVICYVQVNGDRMPEGVVGWFKGNTNDEVVTVRIAYRHPKGLLPGQVIDKYLREYPSDVPKNPTWHHDWEMKDIEKWKDVLQVHKNDKRMLQAGAVYLMRYDRSAFGLLDALNKRDNPVAFSKALNSTSDKMSGWIETRKKVGQRGE